MEVAGFPMISGRSGIGMVPAWHHGQAAAVSEWIGSFSTWKLAPRVGWWQRVITLSPTGPSTSEVCDTTSSQLDRGNASGFVSSDGGEGCTAAARGAYSVCPDGELYLVPSSVIVCRASDGRFIGC